MVNAHIVAGKILLHTSIYLDEEHTKLIHYIAADMHKWLHHNYAHPEINALASKNTSFSMTCSNWGIFLTYLLR